MDIRMPVMDGIEATKRIRKLETGNSGNLGTADSNFQGSNFTFQTKIIALTASSFDTDLASILKAGCDDVVTKPFHDAKIFDMLAKHLKVCFLYEEIPQDEIERSEETIPLDMLHTLPSEWLAAFQETIEELDSRTALAMIEQLDESYTTIAVALADLVSAYRFDTLQSLLGDRDP
jgi:two-component system sensor histidine kinase/response regulator